MGVHSGKWATANGISTLREWSINDVHTPAEARTSNTAFGKSRRKGVNDWTGSVNVFGITPPAYPGSTIAFIGYVAPDNDASGVGLRYSGNAIISQMVLSLNWGAGELLGISLEFGGVGALATPAAQAQITDGTTPTLYPVPGCKVEYSTDGSTYHEWTDLVSATWTLTNEVQTYVNSSTYENGRLWTGRKAGPIDWTLSLVEQNSDRSRFGKGDQLYIRIHLDASGTNYYELKTGLVKDFTGLQVNRETGAILQQTVNVEMNSNDVSDGSLGHILLPDTTVWWGL